MGIFFRRDPFRAASNETALGRSDEGSSRLSASRLSCPRLPEALDFRDDLRSLLVAQRGMRGILHRDLPPILELPRIVPLSRAKSLKESLTDAVLWFAGGDNEDR